jgi:hypothetical protein
MHVWCQACQEGLSVLGSCLRFCGAHNRAHPAETPIRIALETADYKRGCTGYIVKEHELH